MRTPLNSCILGLEYLESICSQEDSLSPSVIVSLAKEIRDSCEDAVEIMNNLLLYEKVDGNALSLSCAPENLYLVVQKVFRSFQLGAQQLGVQVIMMVHPSIDEYNQRDATSLSDPPLSLVHVGTDEGPFSSCDKKVGCGAGPDTVADFADQLVVYVDRPKLHVVLRNLVSNAIKFSPKDDKVLISVDPVRKYVKGSPGQAKVDFVCNIDEATYLRVSVKDNGPGISVENQKLMFGNIVQVCVTGVV